MEIVLKRKDKIKNFGLKSNFKLSDQEYDDIFQEAVIALYQNIGVTITCKFKSYFYIICRNQALKYIRKKSKISYIDEYANNSFKDENEEGQPKGVSFRELNRALQTVPREGITPQVARTPDSVLESKQMRERVYKALNEMSQRCKELLYYYYVKGYSWKELARDFVLQNSDTAKATANRCRNRFKEKYKGLEYYIK